jgi:membrane associated rhomboid family serine protease
MSQFRFRPAGGGGLNAKSVTINLIIINVIFFVAKNLALRSQNLDLDNMLGLFHPLSPNFHWWQLVTHMFMHVSVMHLVFNMLGLFFFGRMLENVWGAKRFLIYYFVCGLGAAAIYLGWETWNAVSELNRAYNGDGWNHLQDYAANFDRVGQYSPSVFGLLFAPMIGASGAVFGLLMGAALLFPNTTIYIYGAIPVKLKWLAIIYGVIEIYSGYSNAQGDNTAHFAHIGGMIFGFILVQIYKRSRNNFY